ncbi:MULTISPECIES: AcvB/VirJ family lysyl-phosphatidylglycerol hydrolase [Pseudomonas]|uniref:AcvB/VirJ family lysyl-phosphatidylglycerol hydrolase n=1 Tax=Pseudomonas TaxID=286 RepID=UPI0006933A4B|nr:MULTISPECIES: AcvB/VirJ family lysyl-phosphatidylglycerol hydrolase [Pseudomonas]OEC52099.1 hypothetical protein A7K61_27260 [Pseudomonas sp. AP42]WEJ04018.1 virulence factor [Pseudomonas sp. FJ2-5-13]
MKRIYALTGILLLAAGLVWAGFRYLADNPALKPYPVILNPPATAPTRHELVIFYSGDRGWAPLEQAVSRNLNERGYGVLGISTQAYFWHEQPVADSAAQLDGLITVYRKIWNAPRVWLVGYSFGANVLPSLIDHLKPENRARITQLTLLDPTEDVFLEIELGDDMNVGWFNRISQSYRQLRKPVLHHDPLPALYPLEGQIPVNCFHSTENADGLCSLSSRPAWITITRIDGSHTFNGDFDGLAQRLIEQHPDVRDAL